MSEQGLCCNKCFEQIAKQSTSAAKLWLDLCSAYLHFGVLRIINEDTEAVKLLESLRFITTTDTSNWILVKVHGLMTDEKNSFFCKGNCHD